MWGWLLDWIYLYPASSKSGGPFLILIRERHPDSSSAGSEQMKSVRFLAYTFSKWFKVMFFLSSFEYFVWISAASYEIRMPVDYELEISAFHRLHSFLSSSPATNTKCDYCWLQATQTIIPFKKDKSPTRPNQNK